MTEIVKEGDKITVNGIPVEDCEMSQCWNGKFAKCPECGNITAKNACLYHECLFGCGHRFYDRELYEEIWGVWTKVKGEEK